MICDCNIIIPCTYAIEHDSCIIYCNWLDDFSVCNIDYNNIISSPVNYLIIDNYIIRIECDICNW